MRLEDKPQPCSWAEVGRAQGPVSDMAGAWGHLPLPTLARTTGLNRHSRKSWGVGGSQGTERKERPPTFVSLTGMPSPPTSVSPQRDTSLVQEGTDGPTQGQGYKTRLYLPLKPPPHHPHTSGKLQRVLPGPCLSRHLWAAASLHAPRAPAVVGKGFCLCHLDSESLI